MPADFTIQCACGAFRGLVRDLSSKCCHRIVCYCDDCQLFAHFLGRAEEIMDSHGGTEIWQMSPARIEFTHGMDQLACVRLTDQGLLRWYVECCKTPIGNTLPTFKVPFVGLIHACLRGADAAIAGAIPGPIRARVHARFASGDLTGLPVHARIPMLYLLRVLVMLVKARLNGDHRRSPFFDAHTGQPRASPQVLKSR